MNILSPVSKGFNIKFNHDYTLAEVDLTDISDDKTFFNAIINTLIVHYQNQPKERLKRIKFLHSDLQNEKFQILSNQMDLFNIEFEEYAKPFDYTFPNKWNDNIEKSMDIDISAWDDFLSDYPGLLTYKTVTGKEIQLRFFGYQIATFKPNVTPDLKNLKLVNNDKMGCFDFQSYYKSIKDKRQSSYDKEKLEHYLESILLKKIQENSLDILGVKIEKIFNSKLNFQFPILLKNIPKSQKINHPKYIDIFARSNDKPVIIELKVHNNTANSRGKYVFEAFSQVLNYYIFLKSVFSNTGVNWGKNLEKIKNLDWNNALIYVIVDDLSNDLNDTKAIEYRKYIKYLKTYFKTPDFIKFVEIDRNFKNELKFLSEL